MRIKLKTTVKDQTQDDRMMRIKLKTTDEDQTEDDS